MEGLVQTPEAVGSGKARVALSFDAWKDGQVAPATVEVAAAVLDVTDSPQIRATLHSQANPVSAVVFAPDGKTLATCTFQGEVKLWDAASAKEKRALRQSGNVYGLAFLSGGDTLATCWYEPIDKNGKALQGSYKREDLKGYRGGIKLWDASTGKERGLLQRQSPRGIRSIALSPDGKMLAADEFWRDNDGKAFKNGIALWDVSAGKVVRDFEVMAFVMTFSPDGKTLALSNREGVLLWDVAAGRQRAKLTAKEVSISDLAFSPDGKTLAGCDLQATVHLWDLSRGEITARLHHGDGQMASCLAFAPDGKTLAVGVGARNSRVVEAGEVVLWDPCTKEKRLTLRGHIGNVMALAFNADGALLASAGADKTVKLWDIAPRAASKR